MGIEEQDNLLREALASYAALDPRPGIEQRVLRRVRSPRLVKRFGWALALATAASVIAVTMIPRQESLEITLPELAAVPPLAVIAAPPPPIHKPDRFPSPAPLTREERALLALADSKALADLAATGITPIQIEPITIPPIGE
jgi:hypothetical protein